MEHAYITHAEPVFVYDREAGQIIQHFAREALAAVRAGDTEQAVAALETVLAEVE